MRAVLLVPGPLGTLSGGYAYDRAMVDGLNAIGHQVETVALKGRFPLPDEVAMSAMHAAWLALPADCVVVIDGLALPSLAGISLTTHSTVGLIHHPTALETGRSEADREKLRAVERDIMPRLARIVVTSGVTSDRLVLDFGVSRDRIRVVVPGTAEAPRSAGSGGPECRILSVGTLVPRKGHDVLIRALARLFDLDWRLTIVGDSTRDQVHSHSLGALAQQLGVAQRVMFSGEAAPDDLAALWSRADLFALATHYEGYGMAVAEALKRGIPVAVTSGGAAAALVTPETGVVAAPGDDIQLSKAMRRIIFDRALRSEMAEAAWRSASALPDWPTQARAFAEAIAI